MRHLMVMYMLAWVALMSPSWAHEIDWQHQNRQTGNSKSIRMDLRPHWDAVIVSSSNPLTERGFEPGAIWDLPEASFAPHDALSSVRLTAGQRMIARLRIKTTDRLDDLNLVFRMERLDAVHISWRLNQEPWQTASAGDLLAMKNWAQRDLYPSFDLFAEKGQLDIVVEIIHSGIINAPVYLENDESYLAQRAWHTLAIGWFSGLHFAVAILAFLTALLAQRASFAAVAVSSLCLVFITTSASGAMGMYMGLKLEGFNDALKLLSWLLWLNLLPWICVLALSIKAQAPRLWWLGVAHTGAATLGSLLLAANYSWRDAVPLAVVLMVLCSLGVSLWIMATAWWHGYRRNGFLVIALLLHALSWLPQLAAYAGYASTVLDHPIFGFSTLAASLGLYAVLLQQMRQSRLLLARGQWNGLRDSLTGLLSREGLQRRLSSLNTQLVHENGHAVLFYIHCPWRPDDQGAHSNELAMVQIAGNLTSFEQVAHSLARVSEQAFAMIVILPYEQRAGERVAQIIISRAIALAQQGSSLAQELRVAMAWLPQQGSSISQIEPRCLDCLQSLPSGKKIAWISAKGIEAAQASGAFTSPQLASSSWQREAAPEQANLHLVQRMKKLEHDMLDGASTEALQDEAQLADQQLSRRHYSQLADDVAEKMGFLRAARASSDGKNSPAFRATGDSLP